MAQNLNTQTSVVDYLKSTGAKSDFGSRTNLAVKQGIVKSAAEYTGSAAQNISLLKSLQGGAGSQGVSSSPADATTIINQNQEADINGTPAKNDVPTRGDSRVSRYSTAFSDIKDIINPSTSRPEAPNFTDAYNKAKNDLGVDSLESLVSSYQAEEEALFADIRQQRTAERSKTVAQNVINGRISQQERQVSERLDYIRRQKQTAVNQLQSANATIQNIINFKKLDYDTARNSYNDQFTQQMSMFNTVKGIVDSQISDEQKVEASSRANLNIIYGAIKDGNMDSSTITPDMKYQINKMELSAGLPTGFYENLSSKVGDSKILSTTTRTTGGAKYADVLTRGKDGEISVKSVYLGSDSKGSGTNSKLTEAELKRKSVSDMSAQLKQKVGSDGNVSPDDYKTARRAWVAAGLNSLDFDKSFMDTFVNKSQLADYELPTKLTDPIQVLLGGG